MFYNRSISEIEENGKKITLLTLAVPLLLENLFLQLYSTANTLLLKGYSESTVTATAVSETIIGICTVLTTLIINGAVILTSFSLGKRDRAEAAKIAGTACITVFAFSLILGLCVAAFSSHLVRAMQLTDEIADIAAGYLTVRALFFPIMGLMSCFNNLLICNGYTKNTMVVGLGSNILNIIFCYIFLYTDNSLPFEGATAVVVANLISQACGLAMAIIFFVKNKCPFVLCFAKRFLGKIMALGIPGGMCQLSFSLSQTVTTSFTVVLGEAMVNAKVYIYNIVMYTSRISIALGKATGILMGRYRGRGQLDTVKQLFRQNVFIAVICNTTLSLLAFCFCKPLISLFTDSKEIIALAIPIMLVDIIIELCRGVNHISESSLNANGDVRATFLISVFSTWVFGVLLAYLLGITFGLGLIGIWIAFATDEMFRTIACFTRWKKGVWKEKEI